MEPIDLHLRPRQSGAAPQPAARIVERCIRERVRDALPPPCTEADARAFVSAATPCRVALIVAGGMAGGTGFAPGGKVAPMRAEAGCRSGSAIRGGGFIARAPRLAVERLPERFVRIPATALDHTTPFMHTLRRASLGEAGAMRAAAPKKGRPCDRPLYEPIGPHAHACPAGAPETRRPCP